MNAATYSPRPDSLPHRVCQYFWRLQDEELSSKDIALKWQADPKNVPIQLKSAVEFGLLARDGMVYSAGPNIAQISSDAAPASDAFSSGFAQAMTGQKPAKQRRPAPPPLDIEAITFERVELPPTQTTAQRWEAKLSTMAEGQSFAVDMDHAHALRAACTAMRKQGRKFRVLLNQAGSEQGSYPMVRVFCLGAM